MTVGDRVRWLAMACAPAADLERLGGVVSRVTEERSRGSVCCHEECEGVVIDVELARGETVTVCSATVLTLEARLA